MHINTLYIDFDTFYIILNTFAIIVNTLGIIFEICGIISTYFFWIRFILSRTLNSEASWL